MPGRVASGLRGALVVAALAGPALGAQRRDTIPAPQDTFPAPSPLPPALSIVADTMLVPFERPNGTLLRPVTMVYDLAILRTGDSLPTPLGVRTVQVHETILAGTPSWLIVESRTGTAVGTLDSLFVSRATLMPERWAATSGRAVLGASFTRDSAYGALQSYQGRSSFSLPLGSGALVTPGMVERVLELLPLQFGYQATASVVLVELGSPRSVAATLSVEREDRLRVGDAEADCWIVALRAGTSEQRLWVTKEAPRVVKTEQTVARGVLTAIARP
ncbi:MAG: hypothetical protein JWL60_2294 [Gemmatimonadetes bacterium]|jgi:hypothetical protein|nr:hypothetical protein [Gemmatimonadota bacterium]